MGSSPSVESVLEHLRTLPSEFDGRKTFMSHIVARGLSESLAAWLSMNLRRTPSGTVLWTLDLAAIQRLLDDYMRSDLTRLYESPPKGLEVMIVAGGASSAWSLDARARGPDGGG